ncbi:hypothetical protein MG290_09985 [Flavobacterium sp. CBA20B-1]|uniref:hypothetical protein n=1 Tax=unclassified Flavobacterium TaxID=196869 RepID=UPI00222412CB|nr:MULTISPECIES: hypothetical protein [unclassified Flavobacterium]WCM41285.1 hypothetical protein MG290_09985 [Flavobacterium sp. CBA20B-1]
MKKAILLLLLINFTYGYGQLPYKRTWGSMIPLFDKPERPFSAVRKILSIPFVSEVNPNNGNLYVVSENFDEVIAYDRESSKSKLIYKIPGSEKGTIITQIKFDSKNNLIITGRTIITGLSTPKAFSKEISNDFSSGYTFITKVHPDGSQAWFTYFYDIPQNARPLAVDKNDDIYIVNKRSKKDTLSLSFFQDTADVKSSMQYQDVITKLNTNGEHVWSTFYAKDDSRINAIITSEKGLYIYGMHLAQTSGSTYFGTAGSYQPVTNSEIYSTASVFLSKFSFDGKRLWSTYFGNEKSFVPYPLTNINKNPSNITVINDEVYFMTLHYTDKISVAKNLITANTLFNKPVSNNENHTLSKFNGNGEQVWSTFIPASGDLYKTFDDDALVISSVLDQKNQIFETTKKAYQPKNAGMRDVYTYMLSLDGKKLLYGSYYGYEADDTGFSIPTINGFFTIGHSSMNTKEKSFFADRNAELDKFTLNNQGVYIGNFLAYFSL